jgi:hypothetical protein
MIACAWKLMRAIQKQIFYFLLANNKGDFKMKRLLPLRRTWIETLFPVAGTGYTYQSDGFTATYLPGRNVVVVEAVELGGGMQIKKICQVADFNAAMEKFPGQNEAGVCGIIGRGIEGFDAAGQIPGVVVETIDHR